MCKAIQYQYVENSPASNQVLSAITKSFHAKLHIKDDYYVFSCHADS